MSWVVVIDDQEYPAEFVRKEIRGNTAVTVLSVTIPLWYCTECGYEFTDQEEGCDACADKKVKP